MARCSNESNNESFFIPFIENSSYDILWLGIDFHNASPQSERVTIFHFLVRDLYWAVVPRVRHPPLKFVFCFLKVEKTRLINKRMIFLQHNFFSNNYENV